MRAGLLSQPEVIRRINQKFVSATLPLVELGELAKSGNALAQEVRRHWQVPLALVFLDSEGHFISRLSSLTDLNEVHPDTTTRPEAPQHRTRDSAVNNARVFLKHLTQHFPDQGKP